MKPSRSARFHAACCVVITARTAVSSAGVNVRGAAPPHAAMARTRKSQRRGTRDAPRSGMDIITWLIVGLVAGVLAAFVIGGYGILAGMVVGMVGAMLGGYIFVHARLHPPIPGVGGPD